MRNFDIPHKLYRAIRDECDNACSTCAKIPDDFMAVDDNGVYWHVESEKECGASAIRRLWAVMGELQKNGY